LSVLASADSLPSELLPRAPLFPRIRAFDDLNRGPPSRERDTARDTAIAVSVENVEIVRRLIEAWNRGDYSAALASIDPAIEVNVAYQSGFDGTYRGHAGLTELMGVFWAEFEGPSIEIEEALPAGDDVVLGVRFSGRGKRSGIDVEAPAWHTWNIREGKAVRWQLFRTKQDALGGAGLSE
jgi:ketosteroid isomerase-like protein